LNSCGGSGLGACCLGPNECINGVDELQCISNPTGIFIGPGSTCADAFCTQGVGVCCFPGNICAPVFNDPIGECQIEGGVFFPGQNCNDFLCPDG